MTIRSMGMNVKGLRSEFLATFDEVHKGQAWWNDLCTTIKSDSDSETYRFLGSVPQMRVWGTGRMAKGLGVESYVVANEKYEATLEVDRDEIADDQTGQIMIRIGELARRAAIFKNYQLAQLLINGESTGFNSYDGVSFFDAAHVSGKSGSQDNQLAFDISDYDTKVDSLPDHPAASTLRQAFDYCVQVMSTFKDDQGLIEDPSLDGLVVVTHPCNWRSWLVAVNAPLLGASATAGGGDSNLQTIVPRILPCAYLADLSKFYLLRTGSRIRPFIFQDREPIEFGSLTKDSDEGFRREKYLYGVRGRYKLTYGLWQNAVSCDLE